ncbi:ABC transporter ATP-binding protein [Wenxinia saemankumensis]|uniref:Peptide/nickel transport system ATP-binding protein n=1 Tax=Wenxinia saemankumensis TaxID=1447782 RepID=A0A1M6HUP3_9RHOB|nr:ABC transporter ATP-binding protein [Wenxinia saemankumensis]SHJ25962.1 peptide/nickel transport system ATP-binding protein [Wenxinia saemankumensis]
MTKDDLLSVRDLTVEFGPDRAPLRVLHEISFDVARGRILGIVGESGSGKSMTAKAVMGMLPEGGRIAGGEIRLADRNLVGLDAPQLRRLRGRDLAMVFQDPQAALNPVKTIGWQIEEALTVHGMSARDARSRALDLLRQVGIPDPETRIDEYPHQFSGGMRQRVVIAIALANSAPLIIADEPTTALDVTIQAQVLRLLVELRERLGVTVVMITHDMGVVAELCDDVIVMYGGRVVERGAVGDIFAAPQHPYTRALLRSMPQVAGDRLARLPAIPGATPDLAHLPPGCAFHPRCGLAEEVCRRTVPALAPIPDRPQSEAACHVAQREGRLPPEPMREVEANAARARRPSPAPILELQDLRVDFGSRRRLLRREPPFYAVDGVSLQLFPGETIGLVGESGCGKTTVSRAIVGVNPLSDGRIRVDGQDVTAFDAAATRHVRQTVQYVFQDPYASLNPRLTIRQILSEALEQRGLPAGEREAECVRLMEMVGLDRGYLDRYPRAFSGGQRQRIGIARALAVEPRVLICDEPVSALDVSIQAQVINILADLRDRLDLALLFIAHDLAVVRHLSDRVAVMYLGRIVEEGPAEEVYARPRHPYTAALMSSTPRPEPDPGAMARKSVLRGDPPDPRNPPSGCRFRTRCPIGPLVHPERRICIESDPALRGEGRHRAACHFSDEVTRPAEESTT